MKKDMTAKLLVIGAGPGGYVCAIRAAQMGIDTVIVEARKAGGTCLNVGCIPTKAWVQSAHAMKDAHTTFAQLGVTVPSAELDFARVQANKGEIVDRMVTGVGGLLKANGVTVLGVNYKDKPEDAQAFLAELGSPYAKIGADQSGRMGIDWGIYGVPESFVLDGKGKVILRFPGPLTQDVIDNTIRPALAQASAGG